MFWTKKDNRTWQDAGDKLQLWVEHWHLPYHCRNVIAHSHGGQVLLYAVAQGLEIRNQLTIIGVPVGKEMQEIVEVARKRIQFWDSVYHPNDDTQRHGSWFDGSFNLLRAYPHCVQSDRIQGWGIHTFYTIPSSFTSLVRTTGLTC